jgi:hypothetical protein
MYVMSFFRLAEEALHLAVSDEGLRWRPVRGGEPILHSSVGSKSIRDPFLCRTADGRFHLLSSDSWNSQSIVHAVSDDLLNWQDTALIPVMAAIPGARNAWAPEAFWDEEASCWRLIWSSSTSENNTPSDFNLRIWSCATEDFVTFTPPALFFDPGYSVIDACVVRAGSRYMMAFKDERGQNPPHHLEPGQRKAIAIAFADTALGPWTEISELVTPALTEGPALFRRRGQWVMIFDQFIENQYGALTSTNGVVWEPPTEPLEFPPVPRHASVLEIPDELGVKLPL